MSGVDRKKYGKAFQQDLGEMMSPQEFMNKLDQLYRGMMSYVQEIKDAKEKQWYGAYAGEDLPPDLMRHTATLEVQRDAMRTEQGKKFIERRIDHKLRRYGAGYAKFPLVQLPWSELRRENDEMERIPQFGTQELEGELED